MEDETVRELDAERQQPSDDEMWACYLEQQQRLSCPACGEAEEVY